VKKSDIQIGGIYAVHLGHGSATRRGFPDDLRRAEVIEFDWTEPQPKDDTTTETRWRVNHTGTRIKLLDPAKRNAYAWGEKAKKGSEHAVPNRALFMPWADYVLERDESKIYDEALEAARRVNNKLETDLDTEWDAYLSKLVLPEDGDGNADRFDANGYGRPDAEDFIILLRHALMAGEESLTAVEKRIAELNAKAQAERRAAVEARNVKLANIGAEVPDHDEEVE
jgi:hypothetical protein